MAHTMPSNPVTKPDTHWSETLGLHPEIDVHSDVWWAWVAAWEHVDTVELILLGAHPVPQITTGPHCICGTAPDIWCPHDEHARQAQGAPQGCICRDARWYPGRPDNPNCTIHGHHQPPPPPLPAVPPCSCRYGLHPTLWCPTHLVDVPGVGQRGAAYTFRISPGCEHHGDLRRAEYFDATYTERQYGAPADEKAALDAATAAALPPDRPYELLLDEDERTGH